MVWCVLGAGVSGKGATNLLLSQHKKVRLFDSRKIDISDHWQYFIASKNLQLCLDTDFLCLNEEGLTVDGLIVSPGIDQTHPLIHWCQHRNITILSEVDLALQGFHGTLVVVTGSNGKSTTASMIYHLLRMNGCDVVLGGNIGVSLAQLACDALLKGCVVAELSSYQIVTSKHLKPHFVVFTSFSPNHLERHKTLVGYFQAKWQAIDQLSLEGRAYIAPEVSLYAQQVGIDYASDRVCVVEKNLHFRKLEQIPHFLEYEHNQSNAALACVVVADFLKISRLDALWMQLFKFIPLEHRMEVCGKMGQWPVINDSKSSNIDSSLAALASLPDKNITLLLGGVRKMGQNFQALLQYKDKILEVIAFGAARLSIESELQAFVPVKSFDSLRLACRYLCESAPTLLGPVLLSPACASYDEFKNFEERGMFFKQVIQKAGVDGSN